MHIFTPFFTTCYDHTCMGEHVWEMVCLRWSNMVVVVNCDSNFISTMVFTNSFVTLLGRKCKHVLKFLLTAKNLAYIHAQIDPF
jgi:hypothetical protein